MMKKPDPRTLRTLLAYHPAFPEQTATDDFNHAKHQGFMFDTELLTHSQATKRAFIAYGKCDKTSISAAFIVGLARNEHYLRAALPAYAVMSTFPNHDYIDNQSGYCADCAMQLEERVDFSFVNAVRYSAGTIVNRKPATLAFCLEQHLENSKHDPSAADIQAFLDVLSVIAESDEKETPSKLCKRLRKVSGVKMNDEQSRLFVDLLGYAGLLETSQHRGFIFEHSSHLTPRKTHSSDWAYPVDFWMGKDGISCDALKFWFDDYPKIANWKPK